MARVKATTFSTPGTWTWTKDPGTYEVDLIIRAAGGGGSLPTAANANGHGGGGGAATDLPRRIPASQIDNAVTVIVGSGGSGGTLSNRTGGNGGASSFGDIILEGGYGATSTAFGRGGYGPLKGGDGAQATQSASPSRAFPVTILSGGGGGGGAGNGNGGAAGTTEGGLSGAVGVSPNLWQQCRSGSGGGGYKSGGTPGHGGFPAGGGGGGFSSANGLNPGGNGAHGCVTVLEYILD